VKRHANRNSGGLIQELFHLDNVDLCVAILRKVFKNVHVWSLLPNYFSNLEDARSKRQLLLNLCAKLQRMKILHTSSKLARKCLILEAIVFEIDADFSRFHRILDMKKSNMDDAIARLRSASMIAGA